MVVKFTRKRPGVARAVIAGVSPADVAVEKSVDPVAEFQHKVEEVVQCFHDQSVTPKTFLELENDLAGAALAMCRQILEREANRVEPKDKDQLPKRVRYRKEKYRLNQRTPAMIATRFGAIQVRSYYYLNEEAGEPGLHPVRLRLGLGAGSATPALVERVARMAVDHTQAEVRAWLKCEYGLTWSNTRLRAALRGFRQALVPYVLELQTERLRALLEQAENSRGRHRPVLAAGRDGVMIPMCCGDPQEACTATVSVYDRQRRRLGTVSLGQMPEPKQRTMTRTLTQLLQATLLAYQGRLPRLAYLTDKGSAPDEYYRRTLKKMRHPRDDSPLTWEWVLDFYHVACYVGTLSETLFGAKSKQGAQWFAKMRRWLRDRRQGIAQVIRSAMQYLDRRKMTKVQKTAFWKAYRYLRRHRRYMDYEGYRRRGLPIGSGVTEAACKTVFTQRFKRSGMRWEAESGQVILDLRVMHLSGIWQDAFAKDLAARDLPEPIASPRQTPQRGSHQHSRETSARIAA